MGVFEVKFNPPVNKNTQKCALVSRGSDVLIYQYMITITMSKFWCIFNVCYDTIKAIFLYSNGLS